MKNNKKKHVLSVFSLAMINIIAVDNLRSLPMAAEYGFSLVFYYILAGLLFFIPTALIAAELATGWPNTGGVYVWVREAFGKRCAFFVIWLQWIYNVVWYPAMMAFLAGMLAYLIDPKLANDKLYMVTVVLVLYWFATYLNSFGMKASSILSNVGALIGTILPMVFIALLGGFWLYEGHPNQMPMNWHSFLPNLSSFNNLSFLVAVLFGLMGMEMSAVHAEEVKNPQRDYPRALLYSTIIILLTLIFAGLAIAMVVPHGQINLVTGMLQAFTIFFDKFHLQWLIPVLVILVVLGGLSGVSSWILGPTKALLVASEDGSIPPYFQKRNRHGAPQRLLIVQAFIVTLLSTLFLVMPSVNTSYWILSALTGQLGLFFYVFLFAAAIRLRYSKPNQHRAYKIPGGNIVMWLVAGAGALSSIAVIGFSFLPPSTIQTGGIIRYESILISGCVLFCLLPLIIYSMRKKTWKKIDDGSMEKA